MKFALKVEEELNKIIYPEYRQLVVETMMLFYMFLEHDPTYQVNQIIKLDEVVIMANKLFLERQVCNNYILNAWCYSSVRLGMAYFKFCTEQRFPLQKSPLPTSVTASVVPFTVYAYMHTMHTMQCNAVLCIGVCMHAFIQVNIITHTNQK